MSIAALEAALSAHPEIESVAHFDADHLITHDRCQVKLKGWWLAEHIGQGDTVQAAYADALARFPEPVAT